MKTKFLSYWTVLIIDIIIISIIYIVLQEFFFEKYSLSALGYNKSQKLLTFLLVNLAFMIYYQTHKGIIRYSSILELRRLFNALAASLLLIAAFDYAQYLISEKKIFNIINLIIIQICCFQGLFAFRLSVKAAYEFIYSKDEKSKKTLLVCLDIKTVNAITSILQNKVTQFQPTAIICLMGKGKGLNHGMVPIYFFETSKFKHIESLDFDSVLVSDNSLINNEAVEFILECKNQGKKIYSINTEPEIFKDDEDIHEIGNIDVGDILSRPKIELLHKHDINNLIDKTVLVTGGAGSIGSEIVRQLVKFNPKSVLILDFSETALHNLELELEEIKNISFKFLLNDINDALSIENIFQKYRPQIVYHAAAYKHVPMMERHPRQSVITNIKASISLAKIATEFNAEKFIYVSTDKAVNPVGVMGTCKRISEIYLNAFYANNIKSNTKTPKFIFTRFGNVLKSNGSVVHRFEDQIKKGGPVTITHPEITRYFMSIEEAASLVIEASFMGNGGEFYVFDMGEPIKIKDLAQNLIKLYLKSRETEIEIEYTGLRPGEKMYEELIYNKAKDLPTHNPKIMISKDNPTNYHLTNILTLDLLEELNQLNNTEIKNKLKTLLYKLENLEINAPQK